MRTENAFWDTSAIVPLCCVQEFSLVARRSYRRYPRPIVWWGTPVEMRSAFRRLSRSGTLDENDMADALRRWRKFRTSARGIFPDDNLLAVAEKMPEKYDVRSLDAFQLAAALTWCGERPRNRPFITADNRLGHAAGDAGFEVINLA